MYPRGFGVLGFWGFDILDLIYIISYFLFSKFVELMVLVLIQTSHVFFHLFSLVNHMASVIQKLLVKHGALLKLMLVEIT